jgi:restriction system protein
MSRYSRSRSNGPAILLILTAAALWAYRADLLYGLAAIMILLAVIKLRRLVRSRHRKTMPTNIDAMSGLDFECYIADLLISHGFRIISLTERYDMGVDIVAEKDGQRWGIQVKRYSGLVKAAAVRQVVTALKFYNCERAMVITNSTYSKVARQLAESNDCVLIDRPQLLKLIG